MHMGGTRLEIWGGGVFLRRLSERGSDNERNF